MVLKNDEFATEKYPLGVECLNCMSKLTIRKNVVVSIKTSTTIKLNILLDLNTIDYIRKFSLKKSTLNLKNLF